LGGIERPPIESDGVIAVTGASRGIGARIALELARRRYRVGCVSRGGKGPEDVAVPAELAPRLVNVTCDVTDEEAVRRALAALAAEPGGLRGLVNNAGIYFKAPSRSMTTAELDHVMETNAVSVFVVSREAYPHLVARGGGTIVNLGSLFDKQGVSRHLAYCAAKAAVGAMTRCLAVEWASKGIVVVNVAPGYVETDFNREFLARPEVQQWMKQRNPLGRAGTADEVARLVAAMFSEHLPYLTGETIYMDGGQGIAH
jgi:NAD(P)-dependent dehydrogenase (short-subunit alcohol dehydrogenase family)